MHVDFSGWATRNNLKCTDGRTIIKDAFKENDGKQVPLVWNHQHNSPENVLGHALLENRDEGVYAYCKFNDTDAGQTAKLLVKHGDINALSIYANQLKQHGANVLHGAIREVSLVYAGANPGAFIDTVMAHGEESDDEAIIYTGYALSLKHADEVIEVAKKEKEPESEEVPVVEEELEHGDTEKKEEEESKMDKNEEKKPDKKDDKTIADVIESMNEDQKNVMYLLVGQALECAPDKNTKKDDQKDDKEEDKKMKHNVFDKETSGAVLMHSDEMAILSTAKNSQVGTLQNALSLYAEEYDFLAHGIDDIDSLFPDYKDIRPGAPELITRDQSWVNSVMTKVAKSPISRVRTRQADIRDDSIRAYGYVKGNEKKVPGNIKLLKRTTDPQTVYRKDALNRDDIIDITDFDVVAWQYGIMRQNLNEELAMAIMIGDGREEGDENKISEEHIRSIWNDDELYTIHSTVDIAAAKAELQGSNTSANFGDNYVYAEAIITAALYAREKYKGSGSLDFYCTPHLLNVMLLARDLNGRRIYDSKKDLAAALNVGEIYTAEQFEGRTRTDSDGNEKSLLGIFVNLNDYQVGSTKGGEITKFNQFDIDFNQEKYLIETRISGALTRVYSAIVLEELVDDEDEG